ncbi:hypothetical protein I9H06_16305 [Pseudomonas tremae]|uniref:hypothetical protein n=1 Tax=Pseudomonas tremae TaxID=200454 RepID=UPI001F1D780C|nr:hypothetical protein [Pseudomonas tremae]MCF5714303.1 hypothetical protein [Pseudomonas tremae]UQB29931.1 hypothetical protein I9H06_16305 [Pseudomonas tremae]
MSIRSLAKNLPSDPENTGCVMGWAVVKKMPWIFIDIYATEEIAEAEAKSLGDEYQVQYGSHEIGTDSFIGGSKPQE